MAALKGQMVVRHCILIDVLFVLVKYSACASRAPAARMQVNVSICAGAAVEEFSHGIRM